MKSKNIGAILFIAVLVSSCSAVRQSHAPLLYPSSHVNTATIADLEVSE